MAGSDRFQARLAVYLLLNREGEYLMMRRANTGYADGHYSLPSGHVDGEEPVVAAMVREAEEEVGVRVQLEDLRLRHVIHRAARDDTGEYIDFYFETSVWEGEPQNCEPDKCDELCWAHPDQLPDPLAGGIAQAFEAMKNDEPYSHEGF